MPLEIPTSAMAPSRAETPLMNSLDEELQRLSSLLDQYEAIATPFLMHVPDDTKLTSDPHPAPESALHDRVIELGRLNHRFANLNARLRP